MKEEVEIAWSLYLSLESEIQRSFEFVYPLIAENKNGISIPYQQIIFASCSEINNLLSLLMEKYSLKPKDFKENANEWNIRLFYKALDGKKLNGKALIDQIKNETVFLDYQLNKIFNNSLTLKPFEKWEDGKSPSWWTAYNDLKHNKSKNFKKANLENAICASSGLLVLIKTIALVLKCSPKLISGTKIMHACKMPRYGATYTGENGEDVISGGTFIETNLPCI